MRTNLIFSALLLSFGILGLENCGQKATKKEGQENLTLTAIRPVPLPDPGIPNFIFPEEEATIQQWISDNDVNNINLHTWGIWTALTMNSGEVYNGEEMLVYETWYTPNDISQAILNKGQQKNLSEVPRPRASLKTPSQFLHNQSNKKLSAQAAVGNTVNPILVTVNYDPVAAEFTIENKLFLKSVLDSMQNVGMTDIPDFPNPSITIKPTYEIVPGPKSSKGLYQMKVWTGPPTIPQSYGQNKWPGCVYVDINNKGQGNGLVDIGCKGPSAGTVYNLSDFIYYTLTQAEADSINTQGSGFNANAGDYAILVAMHVTSREITRWTWQTFWWAPDPNNPPAPSSKAIASMRPEQLQGAASHYAAVPAYSMILPVQPFTGGSNVGTSIYAFNPYLEAGFDPSILSDPALVITNGKTINNNVGIRTNCMSCHAHANYQGKNPTSPNYLGDTYVDMEGAQFKGVLKADFLWSIPGSVINDKKGTNK